VRKAKIVAVGVEEMHAGSEIPSSAPLNVGLIPRLSKLPGFKGYYLMEAGDGVVRSTSLFDTSSQAEDSTRVAAEWTQEKLEKLVPNAPKVITRRVLAHKAKVPNSVSF
jgi:hypothetical protein